jgi:hypothetical protein
VTFLQRQWPFKGVTTPTVLWRQGTGNQGGKMRSIRASHFFTWASLAALFYVGSATLDQDLDVTSVRAAVTHSDVALTDPNLGVTPDDMVVKAALAHPVINLALGEADVKPRSLHVPDDCPRAEDCVDQYLWSIYQRAKKLDTIKVPEQIRMTVKKKGKTRIVTKTIIKFVDEDFTWKDPKAAERAGMSTAEYVIGGMDRGFKMKLYHLLRALDDAGLAPGMTSGFRDDYRQSIASGNKAATDRSYHGGTRRGGYGHGLAADLVSVKGETRSERWISTENLWKWIDAHGKGFGIGRPYLDKDPPHIAPIDGKEYVSRRGFNEKREVKRKVALPRA